MPRQIARPRGRTAQQSKCGNQGSGGRPEQNPHTTSFGFRIGPRLEHEIAQQWSNAATQLSREMNMTKTTIAILPGSILRPMAAKATTAMDVAQMRPLVLRDHTESVNLVSPDSDSTRSPW
jgi:hypothetical protein